jgi:hypothetical protein
VLDTGAQIYDPALTNMGWQVSALITCRTTGASGTVFAQGVFMHALTEVDWTGKAMETTAATTIDTTASQAIAVTAEWDTADVDNTITQTNVVIEMLN